MADEKVRREVRRQKLAARMASEFLVASPESLRAERRELELQIQNAKLAEENAELRKAGGEKDRKIQALESALRVELHDAMLKGAKIGVVVTCEALEIPPDSIEKIKSRMDDLVQEADHQQ